MNNKWLYIGTKNIDFHYPDNLIIIDQIEDFTYVRQNFFESICEYLSVEWNKDKIDFFVYNDDDQTTEVWDKKVKLGFSLPKKLMIHSRYNQSKGHELTHVISAHMTSNWSKLQILNEGLAVALSGIKGYIKRFENYQLNNNLPKLRILFSNKYFLSNPLETYDIGGVFVRFLLNKYGISIFKEVWNETAYEDNDRNITEFEKKYQKSIEKLEKEFINWSNI